MLLVILHHLQNVSVQLTNKWGFKQKKNVRGNLVAAAHQINRQRLLKEPLRRNAAKI
jgi:hypothetical protein